MPPRLQGPLPQDLLTKLAAYDTPTICNALEIVAPERRLKGFTHRSLFCLHPNAPPMVGYARTATIRGIADPISRNRNSARSASHTTPMWRRATARASA